MALTEEHYNKIAEQHDSDSLLSFFGDRRYKRISEIPSFEEHYKYVIDVNGIVYSLCWNKIKPLKSIVDAKGYTKIYLSKESNGKRRQAQVHRLVALAFLERHEDCSDLVGHKDKNLMNNKLENLYWKKKIKKFFAPNKDDGGLLSTEINERLDLVYSAAIRKGLNLPTLESFTEEIINSGLEEYIRRYGLRKELRSM